MDPMQVLVESWRSVLLDYSRGLKEKREIGGESTFLAISFSDLQDFAVLTAAEKIASGVDPTLPFSEAVARLTAEIGWVEHDARRLCPSMTVRSTTSRQTWASQRTRPAAGVGHPERPGDLRPPTFRSIQPAKASLTAMNAGPRRSITASGRNVKNATTHSPRLHR